MSRQMKFNVRKEGPLTFLAIEDSENVMGAHLTPEQVDGLIARLGSKAILNAYGLLEGASTYGRRQAIAAAMGALAPLVNLEASK